MENFKGFDYIKTPKNWKDKVLAAESDNHLRYCRFRVRTIPLILAVLILLTTVTVAANVLNLASMFSTFVEEFSWSRNTTVHLDEYQIEVLKKSGNLINKKFTRNGVTLTVVGVVGDRDNLYMVYTIKTKKKYDWSTYTAFLNPEFYLGSRSTESQIGGNYRIVRDKDNEVNMTYYRIFGRSGVFGTYEKIGEEVVIVIRNESELIATDIDLLDFYQKYGAKEDDDFYSLRNNLEIITLRAALPIDKIDTVMKENEKSVVINNKSNTVAINNVGFIDGKLTIQYNKELSTQGFLDLFRYKVLLRNKRTGEFYKEIGAYQVSHMVNFVYDIEEVKELEDLEIVTPAEYIFTFPIDIEDNTKELAVNEKFSINRWNYTITKARISPISLVLTGHNILYLNKDTIAIKLKDGTVVKDKINYSGAGNKDGEGTVIINFEGIYNLESIDSILIYVDETTVEIPIH
ncbi:UNVERIFIED_CONTAM: uncharacterized protein DUF4179 [Acetivibrio alkalicellulosi]